MTTHDVLRAARAYLLEHGWRQRDLGDHGGPRCAIGAICSAQSEEHDVLTSDEGYPADDALHLQLPRDVYECVPEWNDEAGRTFDEVIAAFDAAIIATAPPSEQRPIFEALEDLPPEQYIDCLSTLALLPAEAIGA